MWICERCVKCTGCTPQLINKYIYLYLYIYTNMYIYIYIYTYINMCMCVCVFVCVCNVCQYVILKDAQLIYIRHRCVPPCWFLVWLPVL